MTRDEVASLLEAAAWRFAKTMPDNPHWYTLRRTWADDAAFVGVVEFILRHGTVERWGRSEYRTLDLAGFHYWPMAARFPGRGWDWAGRAVLINRKPLPKAPAAAAPQCPSRSEP